MPKLNFDEAVVILTEADSRFHGGAYFFLRETLDHTVKLRKRQSGEVGHVTGQQLCEGGRQLALKHFGPMAMTVLEYWGIRKTSDFGEVVWNLIELGVFGKTESDSREDFKDVYSFHEAFVVPYLPSNAATRSGKAAVHHKVQS